MHSGKLFNKRYQIGELLAEGGMAEVYRARDLLLERQVAVKVLRPQYAADRAFLERFQQEARAAAGLAHPNIVSIYDVGVQNGINYIVMELVEGLNLKQKIQQEGPLSPSRAIDVALQVLAALSFAHQRGLVHRDVKPQNILLSGHGHVKVADFGIARAASASQLTETGQVMGSVHYCAPEQAMGKGATQAADVYAFGVVLYELLSGRVPFESDNALGVALKHVQEMPPPLRQLNPALSPGLESIVLRAMAKDPAQRFASAEEMSQALIAFRRLGEQSTAPFSAVPARAPLPPADAIPVPLTVPPVPLPGAADRPRRRGTDWLVVALGVLILALIAAFVPLAWRLYQMYAAPSSAPPALVASGPTPTLPPSTSTSTPNPVVVRNLVGLTASRAEQELKSLGLEINLAGEDYSDRYPVGVVITQAVPAGRSVAPGSAVGVVVSKGIRGVQIPNVLNQLLDDAKKKLEEIGLRVDATDQQHHDLVEQGRIISQYPPAESNVLTGTVVSLVVSRGPRPTPTATPSATPDPRVLAPNLIGLSEGEAQRRIREARLSTADVNHQEIKDVEPSARDFFRSIPVGHVVSQLPAPNTPVMPGAVVRIAVRAK